MNKIHSKRVLIVDYNADAAKSLGMMLELIGFFVFIENHSKDALSRIEHEQFDIFLLDIGLPEINGPELARLLRARPECVGGLFVALISHEAEECKGNSFAAGFHHHLTKPATIPRLLNVLKPRRATG